MGEHDPDTWIFPSGVISGDDFKHLASMYMYARLNMIRLNFPEQQTEIAVGELFHGFQFSEATGKLLVPISKLTGIQKLHFQFPVADEAKGSKLDEKKFIINGDKAPYADAIVPRSRLLLQYKKNEKFLNDLTISRFDVAFEACKAGFLLSPEMRDKADALARAAKIRGQKGCGDADSIERCYKVQHRATSQMTMPVFVFLTDKRIPNVNQSVKDGPFVIMDAVNAECCMPAFVRLGFVFGAKKRETVFEADEE